MPWRLPPPRAPEGGRAGRAASPRQLPPPRWPLRRRGGAGRVATATPAPPRPRRPGAAPPRRRAEEGRGRVSRLRRARGPAACGLLCGGGKMAAHGGSAASSSALKGLIQQFTAITGEAHGSRGPPSPAAAAACLTGGSRPAPAAASGGGRPGGPGAGGAGRGVRRCTG